MRPEPIQPGDCQWIASKLEQLPSDDPQLLGSIDAHLASCAACRAEMEGYEKVDRLLAAYVAQRTRTAAQGAFVPSRPLRIAMAGTGLAVALLGVWLVAGERADEIPEPPRPGAEAVLKAEDGPEALRAKPDPAAADPAGPPDRAAARSGEAGTDFYVTDDAGYFYTLSDFSGEVLILGVFDGAGSGSEGFERLTRTYRSVPGVRVLRVRLDPDLQATGHALRAPDADFPMLTNRGSTLKDTGPGEFSIIGPDGNVRLRGSLEDASLDRIVAANLEGAGIAP